jgi:hypothetical protein
MAQRTPNPISTHPCRESAVIYDVLRPAIRHIRCTQMELQPPGPRSKTKGKAYGGIVIYHDAYRGLPARAYSVQQECSW